MTATGFSPTTFAWFDGLLGNNSKAYFAAHRGDYDAAVVAPLQAMLATLAGEFGGTPHLFRPHRDVRFSPDKSPYKTNASGVLEGRPETVAALYVQLSADGLMAATGYYQMAPDQLARYRAALWQGDDAAANGETLTAILDNLTGGGYEVGGESLKTLPRGVPRDTINADLLRRKSLTVAGYLAPEETIAGDTALTYTAQLWRDAVPLLHWLDTHVGASLLPDRFGA